MKRRSCLGGEHRGELMHRKEGLSLHRRSILETYYVCAMRIEMLLVLPLGNFVFWKKKFWFDKTVGRWNTTKCKFKKKRSKQYSFVRGHSLSKFVRPRFSFVHPMRKHRPIRSLERHLNQYLSNMDQVVSILLWYLGSWYIVNASGSHLCLSTWSLVIGSLVFVDRKRSSTNLFSCKS